MTVIVVSSEITSIFFLAVIILAMLWLKGKDVRGRLFTISAAATVFSLIADAMSYMLEGVAGDGVLWVINFFAICGIDIAIIPFVYYARQLIRTKMNVPHVYADIIAAVCIADIIYILITSITGHMFTLENGVFVPGVLFDYNGIVQAAALLVCFIYVVKNRARVGESIISAIGAYFMLPCLTAVLTAFTGVSLVYVATAVVMELIFVSIQGGEIERVRLREKIMFEVSNTDELTGLNNRRAYETEIEIVQLSGETGVAFLDLNGLKAANDNFGHAAGDELLRKLAGVMRDFFEADEVFRVSGDEFVIIKSVGGKTVFDSQCDKMRVELRNNGDIASMGTAYGIGADILELIKDAEKKMYEDKGRYYVENGLDRRKR